MKGYRYFSIFSGIGGFELGINQAGPGMECIGYSEINPSAIKIYQEKFKEHQNYGNARNIVPDKLQDFDFLCGGFPCQAFSIAGKRGGFEDTRGTLFFEIARILSVKRPKLLLLENVPGLLSHNKGRTFGTIQATLSELGYICEWEVLNSEDFGVPQNRERLFIVGHFGKKCTKTIFPIEKTHQKIRNCDERNTNTSIYFDDSIPKAITRRGRVMNKSGALMTSQRGGVAILQENGEIVFRRFTPIECERLQGFPDDWTKGLSDTQRYKCLGNAVTVNVIQAILEKIKQVI